MIGGIVIGIARGPGSTLLHVQDTAYTDDTCSIRVQERRADDGSSIEIGIGDSIWWGAKQVRWTPKAVRESGISPGKGCGKSWDIRIPRVGYSH